MSPKKDSQFINLPNSPDIVWVNLLDRIERSGDKIKKIDAELHTIKLERTLSISEIYRYAKNPPEKIVRDGVAIVEIRVIPNPDGSTLSAHAILDASSFEHTVSAEVGFLGDSTLSPAPGMSEEEIPVILSSNGVLELEYLGYSPREADSIYKAGTIYDEFQKIKQKFMIEKVEKTKKNQTNLKNHIAQLQTSR